MVSKIFVTKEQSLIIFSRHFEKLSVWLDNHRSKGKKPFLKVMLKYNETLQGKDT